VRTWKLTLEYDGTKYRGWQEQKNARTIQGELRKSAEQYFNSAIELQGAGRTDAGVHAIGQVAHLRAEARGRRDPAEIQRVLNDWLPSDIVITAIAETANRFHARHDAISRSYVYQISTRKSAFSKKYVWWIKEELDISGMQRAAKMIVGRHDFDSFRAADPSKPGESSIVVVDSTELDREDELISFRIEASHYLWRMVRRLVGVLVKLGRNELTLEQFARLLEGFPCEPGIDVASWTAPAAGLFLESVRYSKDV
jgi:tRNA pseudouridine38-40 synthase